MDKDSGRCANCGVITGRRGRASGRSREGNGLDFVPEAILKLPTIAEPCPMDCTTLLRHGRCTFKDSAYRACERFREQLDKKLMHAD